MSTAQRRRFAYERRDGTVAIVPHSKATIRIVVFSDVHSPHHDPHAMELALRIAQWISPHIVILNGDFVDFYAISKFPSRPIRRLLFREEVEFARDLLRYIRKELPDPLFLYLEGNHELRLKMYLWSKAQ
ncbi:MAG: metallophosphoesterase, partial [Candidatus Kapabacteria bacterium]|nr:metallophosphoesterase [Candidatus Kapabacteria bacterium]